MSAPDESLTPTAAATPVSPGPGGRRPIRIANCSGFYGDRIAAAAEMVNGGPIDVLTGDWLAELTMTILAKSAMKGGAGYARTFVTQMRQVLGECQARGIKVVSNAGGLDPQGCADAIAEFAPAGVRIAVVTGDNLAADVERLRESGEEFRNLDTGEAYHDVGWPTLTANAYLGSDGIVAALAAGADVVITGRVTDAALVVGPAAWWHGWELHQLDSLDALAGAVVAGHVIECGAQATGGNYPFFVDLPGLEHPGFPIAEVAADGSSVITKHWDTGGMVSVGTVTAQLLYEVGKPSYPTPDVTALFDRLSCELVGCNRVRISGVEGRRPPDRLKVAMTRLGGFRNTFELVLTGLDIEAKADLVLRSVLGVPLADSLDRDPKELAAASTWDVAEVAVALLRRDQLDATSLAAAQAVLKITVKDPDAAKVGKPITAALIEAGLSSYPGFYASAPPSAGTPFAVLWPTSVAPEHVTEHVVIDGEPVSVPSARPTQGDPTETSGQSDAPTNPDLGFAHLPDPAGEVVRVPLGAVAGARSGDKGGIANIGVWIPDPTEVEALVMASGEVSAWAVTADDFHDTAAVWASDAPLPVEQDAVERADRAYDWLRRVLTPATVADLLGDVVGDGGVQIHWFENLRAINIVLPGALGRGVADSTSVDPQAKSLAEYLRSRMVDVPAELVEPAMVR